MGRHSAVLATGMVWGVLLLAGCGDDHAQDADGGITRSIQACADPGTPAPGRLDTGVVHELADHGSSHSGCDVGYAASPPASGDHFDAWQNCGFYTDPVRDHTAVHALEHGAVWVAFSPDADESTRSAIESAADESTHVLAAPYPDLQNPIVLTAWRRQLAVDDWNDPMVGEFLDSFAGRVSSTAPEAGASCAGGVGIPRSDPDAGYDEIFARILAADGL